MDKVGEMNKKNLVEIFFSSKDNKDMVNFNIFQLL